MRVDIITDQTNQAPYVEIHCKDVTEDVFVKVLTGSFSFESEEHEKAWLARATINQAKDVLKSAWRKPGMMPESSAQPCWNNMTKP